MTYTVNYRYDFPAEISVSTEQEWRDFKAQHFSAGLLQSMSDVLANSANLISLIHAYNGNYVIGSFEWLDQAASDVHHTNSSVYTTTLANELVVMAAAGITRSVTAGET